MGPRSTSDFNLVSEGHCFFCLKEIHPKIKQEPERIRTPKFQNCSVHYLAHYLQMDMGKVFSDRGQIDSTLLAKVRRSRLKVELCEKCANLNESFSGLYQQLEKLELEITSSLRLIHEELLCTNRSDQHLPKFPLNSSMRNEVSEIVDVLRHEAIQKCSKKLRAVSPRVGIRRLTKKKIDAQLSKRQNNSGFPETDPKTTSHDKIGELESNVKTEFEPPNENILLDDETRNYDMDGEVMDDEPINFSASPRVGVNYKSYGNEVDTNPNSFVIMSTESPSGKMTASENYSINPESKRWKCNVCSMEFASKCGINSHYNSAHLKIRYKCVPCGKEFVHKHVYNRHHQSVHVGMRFKCLVCNKIFTQKGHLQMHQRKDSCRKEAC